MSPVWVLEFANAVMCVRVNRLAAEYVSALAKFQKLDLDLAFVCVCVCVWGYMQCMLICELASPVWI